LIHSCKITAQGVWINGKNIYRISEDSEDWKKELYKKLQLSYPKFFKMDDLSKMSILTFEFLKKELVLDSFNDDEIALLLGNKNSSLYTDNLFSDSYLNKKQASPSLFVYTLPNITIGELAIKNKFYGENIFLIAANFEQMPYLELVNNKLQNYSKACLCGWVEKTINKEECFLFFTSSALNNKDLNELYKKYKN